MPVDQVRLGQNIQAEKPTKKATNLSLSGILIHSDVRRTH